MKKILIVSHSLELGGAERSLIGLLENIDKKSYQVDLFLLRRVGELLPYVPEGVNLLPESRQYGSLGIPMKEALRNGQFRVVAGRIKGKVKARKRIKELQLRSDNNVINEYSHKYTVDVLPLISKIEYDLAISFMSPHYFVSRKVKAKKKIAWIHTDYATFQIDAESELQMWNKYDYIASISDEVSKNFISIFPSLKERMILIQNILPMRYLLSLSEAFSVENEMINDGSVKLLSVGRFCNAKNFDNIPFICRDIRKSGIDARWYIIGYGGDEKKILDRISETGMEKYVIILGKKENPYPYIKACDLYVQPSRYEGKCVSVIEAQTLHKPVVITNYSTAAGQLENGEDGMIVPLNNAQCAEAIVNILNNSAAIKHLIHTTELRDYSNRMEVEKLYALIPED